MSFREEKKIDKSKWKIKKSREKLNTEYTEDPQRTRRRGDWRRG
jgi:hypothetical protein